MFCSKNRNVLLLLSTAFHGIVSFVETQKGTNGLIGNINSLLQVALADCINSKPEYRACDTETDLLGKQLSSIFNCFKTIVEASNSTSKCATSLPFQLPYDIFLIKMAMFPFWI